MLKNEKGITLTILVVTIIVMLILAGVIMSINMNLNKEADLKEIVSNMELIRSAASIYRDKYIDETVTTEGDDGVKIYTISDKFIGTKTNINNTSTDTMYKLLSYSNKSMLGDEPYYWFELSQDDLNTLGIDITLNNDKYFVNYKTLSVAYCQNERDEQSNYKGILARKDGRKNEKYYYFYEDVKNLKTDEVRN